MSSTLNLKERTEYAGIDLFKLIFSFFIVFIHCHPSGTLSYLTANGVGRLGVPFFFCAAGYFLAKKIYSAENSLAGWKSIGAYLLRIFKMYALWTVIYLPMIYVKYVLLNKWDFSRCLEEFKEAFFFTGSFSQLWYLPALLVAAAIVALLAKCRIHPAIIVTLGAGLFVIGMFNEAYRGLCPEGLKAWFEEHYDPIFVRTRNGLFFGTVFVAMGFLFAKKDKFEKNYLLDAGGLLFFGILVCMESYMLYRGGYSGSRYGMYLSVIPATFFCFRLARTIELPVKPKTALMMRKVSTLIYLSHLFMNALLISYVPNYLVKQGYIKNLGLNNTKEGFFIILFAALGFSMIITHLGSKKNFVGKLCRFLT